MKITKNTSGYSTRELKKVIVATHNYIKKFEKRSAPNWKNLSVHVRGRDNGNHVSGRAFYDGLGYVDSWDVVLTIPRENFHARRFAWLVYHELHHTYGYNHKQFTDANADDLAKIVPDDYRIPYANEVAKPKAPPPPKWKTRYESLIKRRAKWESKQRRAENALQSIAKKLRYYERTYGDQL